MINLKYLTKGCKIKEIKTNKQGIIYVRFITCILKKVVLMNNSQKLVSLLKYCHGFISLLLAKVSSSFSSVNTLGAFLE